MESSISFVIPMYNRAKTICYCLDSILCQEKSINYEILIIDDASEDESSIIVKEIIGDNRLRLYESSLSNKLPNTISYFNNLDSLSEFSIRARIKLFQQETHQGSAAARNIGLYESTGKYIWFVDSDDFIAKDALQKLSKIIECNDYDIIRFSTKHFSAIPLSYEMQSDSTGLIEMSTHSVEDIKFMLNSGTVWSRIFRRDFIKNFRFNTEYSYSEDSQLSWRATLKSKNNAFLKDTLYGYMSNPDSLTSKKPYERFSCYVNVVGDYMNAIRDSDLSEEIKNNLVSECEKRLYFHAFYTYSYHEITKLMWDKWYEVYYDVMINNDLRPLKKRVLSKLLWGLHMNTLFIIIYRMQRKGIPVIVK